MTSCAAAACRRNRSAESHGYPKRFLTNDYARLSADSSLSSTGTAQAQCCELPTILSRMLALSGSRDVECRSVIPSDMENNSHNDTFREVFDTAAAEACGHVVSEEKLNKLNALAAEYPVVQGLVDSCRKKMLDINFQHFALLVNDLAKLLEEKEQGKDVQEQLDMIRKIPADPPYQDCK